MDVHRLVVLLEAAENESIGLQLLRDFLSASAQLEAADVGRGHLERLVEAIVMGRLIVETVEALVGTVTTVSCEFTPGLKATEDAAAGMVALVTNPP